MLRKLIRVWIVGIVFPLYAIAGQPSVKIGRVFFKPRNRYAMQCVDTTQPVL